MSLFTCDLLHTVSLLTNLFNFRFDHYAKLHDVQTLAMLACVFQEHCLQFDQKPKKHPTTPNSSHGNNNHLAAVNRAVLDGSPPKKFHGQPPLSSPQERSSWGNSVPITSPISGSWQEVSENDLVIHETEDPLQEEQSIHEMKCRSATHFDLSSHAICMHYHPKPCTHAY